MVQKLPKRSNLDVPAGRAPGAMGIPPTQYERGDPISASQLRGIAELAARPNQLNRSQPAMHFAGFSSTTPEIQPTLFFEGVLLEDMPASTDVFNDPICVEMKCLRPLMHKDTIGQEALTFSDNGSVVIVTNRSVDLEVSAGTYIICVAINGEKRPIWADCGSDADSTSDIGGGNDESEDESPCDALGCGPAGGGFL